MSHGSKVNGRADGSLSDIYLRCDIGPSLTKGQSYENGLGVGTFIDCYVHDKNSAYNYGGIYKNKLT